MRAIFALFAITTALLLSTPVVNAVTTPSISVPQTNYSIAPGTILAIPVTVVADEPRLVTVYSRSNTSATIVPQNHTMALIEATPDMQLWHRATNFYIAIPADAIPGRTLTARVYLQQLALNVRNFTVMLEAGIDLQFQVTEPGGTVVTDTMREMGMIVSAVPEVYQPSQGELDADLAWARALLQQKKEANATTTQAEAAHGLKSSPDLLFIVLALFTIAAMIVFYRRGQPLGR